MSCQDFDEIIVGLARDQLLEASLREKALVHTERCTFCSGRLVEQKNITDGVRAVIEELAPREASTHVREAVRRAFRECKTAGIAVKAVDHRRPRWGLVSTVLEGMRIRIESAFSRSPRIAPTTLLSWRVGPLAASILAVLGAFLWFAFGARTPTISQPGQRANRSEESKSDFSIAIPTSPQNPKGSSLPVPREMSRKPNQRPHTLRRGEAKQPESLIEGALRETQIAYAPRIAPASEGSSFFDFETAMHLEKAQVLLRSFENTSFSRSKELAYEQQESRNLLYRNILLRREAESEENAPVKSLLGNLEPLLLDISNLPAKPSSGDLRSVKVRIRKSEIIVALQVYSTPTPSLD